MNKVYNYLGLAQRARKVVSGEETVERAARKGKVVLLIIAKDASDNTKDKFISLAQYRHIKFWIFGEKDELGRAIGKPRRAVVGVTDTNFANVICSQLVESVEEKN